MCYDALIHVTLALGPVRSEIFNFLPIIPESSYFTNHEISDDGTFSLQSVKTIAVQLIFKKLPRRRRRW
jgi:hypothetical protein